MGESICNCELETATQYVSRVIPAWLLPARALPSSDAASMENIARGARGGARCRSADDDRGRLSLARRAEKAAADSRVVETTVEDPQY